MTQDSAEKPSEARVTDAELLEYKYDRIMLEDIQRIIDRALRRERERVIEEAEKILIANGAAPTDIRVIRAMREK